MTDEERTGTEREPAGTMMPMDENEAGQPDNPPQEAPELPQQTDAAEEGAEPDGPETALQKRGPGTAATFWLLLLYDFPGIGIIASALSGFWLSKTRAHRSLARACFFRGLIVLFCAGIFVGGYFFLRSRFALSNFLERMLQSALDFVRSNGDKL